MRVLYIGIFSVVLVLLSGCNSLGLGSNRVDYRAGAAQAPALEIPPDLTAPGRDERYRMPRGDDETVATFSDYNKSGASATRPRVKSASLERNGTQRWLLVKDNPENVWLVVKTFLQENNFPIRSEDQAAGVIETDWAENRPNVPRNWFEKILDKVNSSGERNQYRFRLESGKDGASTEIYVTHRGMEVSSEGNDMKWQGRPNDPELEAVMLQRLMVRFGSVEAQADSGTATGASGMGGAAILREIFDGSSVIVVHDAFDRSWRRVGLAIERAGFVVEDKDRAKGTYFLRMAKAESGWMDKLQFWKDSPNTDTRYRVSVKDDGTACEVTVTDMDGVSDNATKHMLEAIYKNIDQGEAGAAPAAASAAGTKVLTIGATGPAGTASLQEVFDGSSVIVVNDVFDKSWRRVGLAIERAGLIVETNDRAKGIYFLRPAKAESGWLDKLQFWRDSEDTNTRYRVNVKDGGKACEVSVTDQDGVSDVVAKQMIEAIYKNISQ